MHTNCKNLTSSHRFSVDLRPSTFDHRPRPCHERFHQFEVYRDVRLHPMSSSVLRRKLGELVGGSGVFASVSSEFAPGRLFSSSSLSLSSYKVRGFPHISSIPSSIPMIRGRRRLSCGPSSPCYRSSTSLSRRSFDRLLITSMTPSLSELGVPGCVLRWDCPRRG